MIYTIPIVKAPVDLQYGLKSMSTMETNEYNARTEISERDEFWMARVRYANMDTTFGRLMKNFFHKLRGPVGEFYLEDIAHEQQGSWGGTPRVKGANQDGTALEIDGATASTLIAPAGDRFQLNDHLYELTEDATTNASGEVELRFLPDLRVIPIDNTQLIVTNPKCKFNLEPGQEPPNVKGRKRLAAWEFRCRESLR